MKWYYRILRYGNNGYKIQYRRNWIIFGKKYRGFWHNFMTGFVDATWVAEFKTIEAAKKRIDKEKKRDKNDSIGWNVVCEF